MSTEAKNLARLFTGPLDAEIRARKASELDWIPPGMILEWLREVEAECVSGGDTRYADFVAGLRSEVVSKWGEGFTEEELTP